MNKTPILFALSALMLVSCGGDLASSTSSIVSSSETSQSSSKSSSSLSSSEPKVAVDFKAPITAMNDKARDEYEFDFRYESSYFEAAPSSIGKGMTMFAYAMANASASHERASKVFADATFAEHYEDATLSAPTGTDTIGYAIGSRKVDGVDQIIVSVRGENYGAEWSSNLYSAPKEEKAEDNGDHYGFRVSALAVMGGVRSFVQNSGIQKAKYLFTGYSRGGAVASLCAAMMIDAPVACAKGDVYAYTFEAPAAMLKEHDKDDYNAIHNFVNENDFVPLLMPSSYGFVRPGEDVFIAGDVVEYGPLFEEAGMTVTTISEKSEYGVLNLVDAEGQPDNSGKAAHSFLLNVLTRELTAEEVGKGLISYHTKEEYRDNAMPAARDLVALFAGLDFTLDLSSDSQLAADALGLIQNLWAEDGYPLEDPEKEQPAYDPHRLATVIEGALERGGILPDDQKKEGDDPSKYYDKAVLDRSADAVQAVLRNWQLGLTKHYYDLGADINDARNKLGSVALVIFMANTVIKRHSFDTTYAVLNHYVNRSNTSEAV